MGATSYQVSVGNTTGNYGSPINTKDQSITLTGISACTIHYIVVRAISMDSSSSLSKELVAESTPFIPKVSFTRIRDGILFVGVDIVAGNLIGEAGVSANKLDIASKADRVSGVVTFDFSVYDTCPTIYYRLKDVVSSSCTGAYSQVFMYEQNGGKAPVSKIDFVTRAINGDVLIGWSPYDSKTNYEVQLKQANSAWKTVSGPPSSVNRFTLKYPTIPNNIDATFRIKSSQYEKCPSFSADVILKAI